MQLETSPIGSEISPKAMGAVICDRSKKDSVAQICLKAEGKEILCRALDGIKHTFCVLRSRGSEVSELAGRNTDQVQ